MLAGHELGRVGGGRFDMSKLNDCNTLITSGNPNTVCVTEFVSDCRGSCPPMC